jgi:hypothetical protein
MLATLAIPFKKSGKLLITGDPLPCIDEAGHHSEDIWYRDESEVIWVYIAFEIPEGQSVKALIDEDDEQVQKLVKAAGDFLKPKYPDWNVRKLQN